VAPSPPNYIQAQPFKSSLKQPHSTANPREQPAVKPHQYKSKPIVRKVAKLSEQSHQGKPSNQGTTITPSSWRAGRDAVHRVLGPPKKQIRPPKQSQDHELTAGDSSSSVASSTGIVCIIIIMIMYYVIVDSVGLTVKSKQLKPNMTDSSPSKENAQIPLLNANAATVLSELGLSKEDDHQAPKPIVKPTKRPLTGVSKVFNPGK